MITDDITANYEYFLKKLTEEWLTDEVAEELSAKFDPVYPAETILKYGRNPKYWHLYNDEDSIPEIEAYGEYRMDLWPEEQAALLGEEDIPEEDWTDGQIRCFVQLNKDRTEIQEYSIVEE